MLHTTQNLTSTSTAAEDIAVVDLNGSNYLSETNLTISGCAGTFGTFDTYGCDGATEITTTDIVH